MLRVDARLRHSNDFALLWNCGRIPRKVYTWTTAHCTWLKVRGRDFNQALLAKTKMVQMFLSRSGGICCFRVVAASCQISIGDRSFRTFLHRNWKHSSKQEGSSHLLCKSRKGQGDVGSAYTLCWKLKNKTLHIFWTGLAKQKNIISTGRRLQKINLRAQW